MMKMLMSTSITLSMLFPMMKHPLSMGTILLLQTLMIAMMSGMLINMFWFSYILIMSMLSGLLILFMYMASISSNEKFNSPILLISTTPITLSTMYLFNQKDHMKTMKMWSYFDQMTEKKLIMSLNKLFSTHNMMLTITLILYLLMTMIIISYIINMNEGPLRKKVN